MGRDRGCVSELVLPVLTGHPEVGVIHLTATSPLAADYPQRAI